MNRILQSLVVLIAFLPVFRPAFAGDKQARYEITVLGKNVGEFIVSQSNSNDTTTVHTSTNVAVKILFTFRVKLEQNSVHCGGKLCGYSIQTMKDDKINSDTQMWTEGADYLLVKDGDSTLLCQEIRYSGSLIYFNEPKNVEFLYNEREAKMESLQKTGEQSYATIDEKGRKINEYHYCDGILQSAALQHKLATVYLSIIKTEELSAK